MNLSRFTVLIDISAGIASNFGQTTRPDSMSSFSDYIKLIFSWVVLLPVSVIIGGKLITCRLRLPSNSDAEFTIRIRFLTIRATGDEVILGFAGFLVMLFLISLIGGQHAHWYFVRQFGMDPGQFLSLCVFSAFGFVFVAAVVYIISFMTGKVSSSFPSNLAKEHEEQITSIARKDEAQS